ncbi:MAG: hypothetical protein QOF89_6009 [Acidobacteriota bacterium]|jgi:uncharacterized membrane protein|nr:hypothetical protein [Acidobacteriota bacterium]
MPVPSSYADVIKDWEALLTAALEHAQSLPDAERTRIAFQDHVARTKEMKARQESLTAARQEATQSLRKLVKDGKDLAIRLRGAVKANLGPTSEGLVQFGIAPVRKRAARKTKSPEPETPTPPVTKPAA